MPQVLKSALIEEVNFFDRIDLSVLGCRALSVSQLNGLTAASLKPSPPQHMPKVSRLLLPPAAF